MNEFEKVINDYIKPDRRPERDIRREFEDIIKEHKQKKEDEWKNVVIRYKSGREKDAEIVGVKEGSVYEAAIALMALTNAISQGDKERAGRLHDCISAALEKHFRNEVMRVLIGGMC